MFFKEIIHGTQYYRTPTPLPEEWAGDIEKFEEYNIDAFQIRMNWRWNERKENEYDFSDVDRLLELAEKNGRKVIMKFLLECARLGSSCKVSVKNDHVCMLTPQFCKGIAVTFSCCDLLDICHFMPPVLPVQP